MNEAKLSGPNRLAVVCAEQIPKIQAMLAAEKDKAERKRLNRWLMDVRRIEWFAESKARLCHQRRAPGVKFDRAL